MKQIIHSNRDVTITATTDLCENLIEEERARLISLACRTAIQSALARRLCHGEPENTISLSRYIHAMDCTNPPAAFALLVWRKLHARGQVDRMPPPSAPWRAMEGVMTDDGHSLREHVFREWELFEKS